MDTNVIIHLYRADLQDMLFDFFSDGVFIYEQIRNIELVNHGRDILEKDTDSSIKEVALSVGYDDAYHFSKLFKKKYGVSPSEVKKGNRSTQVCAHAAQTVRT